jgi:hypothetical protein
MWATSQPRNLAPLLAAKPERLRVAHKRQWTTELKQPHTYASALRGRWHTTVHASGLRQTHNHGAARTHLRNCATAAAANAIHLPDWLEGMSSAATSTLLVMAFETCHWLRSAGRHRLMDNK